VTLCLLSFSSCFEFAAVGEIGEAGAITEVGVADAAVSASEGTLLESFSMSITEGRLTLSDEATLERIQMSKAVGGNPKLYVEGNTQPFAEVFPEEERGVLLGEHGGEFSINEDIFAVSEDNVYVISPSLQIYYKTHTAYCFSSNCKTPGKSLDVIDFILYKENITKHEAIKQAEAMIPPHWSKFIT